jgi:hypothetical protein
MMHMLNKVFHPHSKDKDSKSHHKEENNLENQENRNCNKNSCEVLKEHGGNVPDSNFSKMKCDINKEIVSHSGGISSMNLHHVDPPKDKWLQSYLDGKDTDSSSSSWNNNNSNSNNISQNSALMNVSNMSASGSGMSASHSEPSNLSNGALPSSLDNKLDGGKGLGQP